MTLHRMRLLESVRCLDCGSVYAKPCRGGTAATNPGCPECGYLGWALVGERELSPLRRFSSGRRLPRFV